jgi:hypothetical protein
MIYLKSYLLVGFSLIFSSCKSGESESVLIRLGQEEPDDFIEYPSTLVLKEQNLRFNARKYAISSLPKIDSVVLTPVNIPMPGTNGKFDMLAVKRGEQYNVQFPGNSRAFINAATLFFVNFSSPHKYYIVQGKAWLKSGNDSVSIKADDFTIHLAPNSALNVDNYLDDSNIIISLIEGAAKVTWQGDSMQLAGNREIWMARRTGKMKTTSGSVDVTDWTRGAFRQFDVDFIYQINELGRLYNKDVYIGDISGTEDKTYPLDFNYRNVAIKHAVNYYNNINAIDVRLSGDSLIVSKR